MRLFLAMLFITTIEVILIAKVGAVIGFFMTFLIIIATAIIGSWQLKKQWRLVIGKLSSLQSEPSDTLVEALILLICGVLLITPGFLTDIIGFCGLVPLIRQKLVAVMKRNVGQFRRGNAQMYSSTSTTTSTSYDDNVLEGEFERKDKQ
ncbi:MAG: FxsA family protein [Ostreibacterium sp.]